MRDAKITQIYEGTGRRSSGLVNRTRDAQRVACVPAGRAFRSALLSLGPGGMDDAMTNDSPPTAGGTRIDIAPGVSTPGSWDLRGNLDQAAVAGRQRQAAVSDVGTMDGFWAFELERRGAAEVVADRHRAWARGTCPLGGGRKASGPPAAREADIRRRSRAARLACPSTARRSVYDLDPEVDGEFDVVVMGFRVMADAARFRCGALAAVHSVCREHLFAARHGGVCRSRSCPSPLARPRRPPRRARMVRVQPARLESRPSTTAGFEGRGRHEDPARRTGRRARQNRGVTASASSGARVRSAPVPSGPA